MPIEYKKLTTEQLTLTLFLPFNRFQKITNCFRKEANEWILQNISFTEDWGQEEKIFLADCLQNTLIAGGVVYGAFDNTQLVGFASLENDLFGSHNQYLQLSSLHVSYEYRGNGIGKVLFELISNQAKTRGASKLYISAHSAQETQAFYKCLGCIDAREVNSVLLKKEPDDRPLEYVIVSSLDHARE